MKWAEEAKIKKLKDKAAKADALKIGKKPKADRKAKMPVESEPSSHAEPVSAKPMSVDYEEDFPAL